MESVIINFEERGASRTADKVSTLNSEFRNMKSVMTSLNQVIKQSDDKTEGLNYKFRLLTEMMKNADARMSNYKNEIKSLGTQMEASGAKVKSFRESVGQIEANLRGTTTAISQQELKLSRLNGHYESGKLSLKQYTTQQEALEGNLTALRTQQSNYETALAKANASLKTATTEHNKLNTALTRATTGLMNAQTQYAQYSMEIKQVENRLESLGSEATETGNDIERLGNEARASSANMDKLGRSAKDTGDSFSGVNGKLLSFTLGMQEIGQQLRQATRYMFDFGMESYQTAKKVQSTAETTTRVYKDLADEQKAWASETSKAMGVFENDLADASAKMYSLAQSFGTTGTLFEGTAGEMTMSSEDLMVMTQKLTERAYDLAATYDTSVEQALGAVLSATKGNTEAIEDYGVSVQANALEQVALSKGIEKSVEKMTQAEKTALVMEQILDKTADTAGRYAYEIEAGLNPMLQLDTAMKDLQATMGERLKPLFDKGVEVIISMMEAISNLSPELMDLGIAVGVAVAGLAVLSTIIGGIGVLVLTLGPLFGTIMLPLTVAIGATIPLVTAFLEHLRTGEDVADIVKRKFKEMGDFLVGKFEKLSGVTKTLIGIVGALGTAFVVLKTAMFISSAIDTVFLGLGKLAGLITTATTAMGGFTLSFGALKGVMLAFQAQLTTVLFPAIAGFATAIGAFLISPIGLAVIAITALVAGLGYLIYQGFQPAIKSTREYGDAVDETTEKAVNSYRDLHEEVSAELLGIKYSNEEITQETVDSVVGKYAEMKELVLGEYNEQKDSVIASMESFYARSGIMSEGAEADALAKLKEGFDKREASYDAYEQEIIDIMNTASEEKRTLTHEENAKIEELQGKMQATAVNMMAESSAEQLAILGNLKANTEALSTEQLSTVLTNSAKQRDQAIADAEAQAFDTIGAITYQRDVLGTLTAKQADELIMEATRQKDGAIEQAKQMHQDVVTEAEQQSSEHIGYVNTETGEIKTKWEQTKEFLKQKSDEMKTNWINFWDETGEKVSTKMTEINTWINNKLIDIGIFFNNLIFDVKLAWTNFWSGLTVKTQEKMNEINTWINTGIDKIIAWFKAIPGKIGDWFAGVAEWASTGIENIKTWISTGIDNIVEWFQGIPGRIGDWFAGLVPQGVKDFVSWAEDKLGGGSSRSMSFDVEENVSRNIVPQLATVTPFAGVNTNVPHVMTESGYSAERQATLLSSYGSNTPQSNPSEIFVENNQPLHASIENVVVLDGKEMTRYTENVVVKKLAKDKRTYKRS